MLPPSLHRPALRHVAERVRENLKNTRIYATSVWRVRENKLEDDIEKHENYTPESCSIKRMKKKNSCTNISNYSDVYPDGSKHVIIIISLLERYIDVDTFSSKSQRSSREGQGEV